MSRIGRAPITLPAGVEIDIGPGRVGVKGPRGTLEQAVPHEMTVSLDDGVVTVTRPTDRGPHRSLHGLTRTLVANMVEGVTNGYEKRLEIQGVGYRAALRGSSIELLLGFSHPIVVEAPAGIEFEVPAPTQIVVRGIDKQSVGQVAADIRRLRPPEPYKGKGIRYAGEIVRRKVGKRA
ncbi:MAG: large subunit ribosomal protein [Gaiellales bacterium]|jgi:large subunit ribosomal protein L6|nr:large subunit ribosomal protein [Gaiellales bacterium]